MKLKTLLLALLLTLGFIGSANSEERVDMICTLLNSLEVSSGVTKKLTPSDYSLVIFPEIQNYMYDGFSGSYSLKGNSIVYTTCPGYSSCSSAYMKSDFSIDRTTGLIKEYWYTTTKKITKETRPGLIFTGKCKKTENLF